MRQGGEPWGREILLKMWLLCSACVKAFSKLLVP